MSIIIKHTNNNDCNSKEEFFFNHIQCYFKSKAKIIMLYLRLK